MPSTPKNTTGNQYRRFSFGRRRLRQQDALNEQAAELLKVPINEPGKHILNPGEDDQMIVEGYKSSTPRKICCWISIILTLGAVRLLLHWRSHWLLFVTHKPCSLAEAEKVLVTEVYNGKHTVCYVKTIETITADSVRNKADEDNNFRIKDGENGGLSVHISNGIFNEMDSIKRFFCKKLCYIWDNDRREFVKLRGLDKGVPTSNLHQEYGLSPYQQFMRRIVYGRNEIVIPVKSITTLLFLEVLNPFYVFQIFSFSLWFADNYYYYASTIILMSAFGVTSTIVQTRRNQRALRSTIHSSDVATVLRDTGITEVIGTEYLVPGDILEIPSHGCIMHCDAVLLTGNCILNEAMLTGESVPVTKTPLPQKRDLYYNSKEHARHTLFCGTRVIQTRYFGNEKVKAIVTASGNLTEKGGLVRSILYPPPVDYKFERDSYRFVVLLAGIASIGFIYTIITKYMRKVQIGEIALESLDLITIVVPPALPAAMTVGRMYAQRRLKENQIYCISPRSINVAGSINCVCFDKTGTLTEDGLDMWGIIPNFNRFFQIPLKEVCMLPQDNFLFGMVTCHSITLIDGQMSGDPLDLKMFESTNWILEEHNVADDTKFDMLFPTVVKPLQRELNLNDEIPLEIGIVREFPFSSSLQRMSVITRTLSDNHFNVYCKGSPEMISSLCDPITIPDDFHIVLEKYAQQGYRIIAMGYKELERKLTYPKVQRISREKVECDLKFLGLIILENRLKSDTTPVITTLMNANIKTVMVTGDNILTAISVGKDCGIITKGQGVITVNAHTVGDHFENPEIYFTLEGSKSSQVKLGTDEYSLMTNSNSIASLDTIESCTNTQDVELGFGPEYTKNVKNRKNKMSEDLSTNNYRFALTGKTWAVLKEHFPELLPKIITRGAIFARMSPDQKQQLILELMNLGYYVAMCGDGANDCGALKAAHTGISLSEAESSVASPFTSKNPTIACVPNVIREGRSALVTSFGIFKYMAAYSLTQFVSVMILYSIDSNLTDTSFLYIDLCMISVFAFFFGKTEAYDGSLVKQTPLNSLMSLTPILSVTFQMVLVIAFQCLAFFHLQSQPWYVPFDGSNKPHKDSVACNENYVVFTMSSFQYIILAIVFSKGPPYRKSIFSNYGFLISCIVMTALTVYLTLGPAEFIKDFMELIVVDPFEFRVFIVIYGALNFILAVFIEVVVVEYFIFGKLSAMFHNIEKSPKKYLSIENQLRLNTKWPPLTEEHTPDVLETPIENSPSCFANIYVEKTSAPPLDKSNVLNKFFEKGSTEAPTEVIHKFNGHSSDFEVMLNPSMLSANDDRFMTTGCTNNGECNESQQLLNERNTVTINTGLNFSHPNISYNTNGAPKFVNKKINRALSAEQGVLEMSDLPRS